MTLPLPVRPEPESVRMWGIVLAVLSLLGIAVLVRDWWKNDE